jgi:hypothetical protein
MAHSIIDFQENSVRVHDLDLAVACFLLIQQEVKVESESITKLFEEWIDSISFDGPGCIDLHLNDNLGDERTVRLLKELIDATIQSLRKTPGFYPKERLNSIMAKANISIENDYRVDLILNVLVGLRSLVAPRESSVPDIRKGEKAS